MPIEVRLRPEALESRKGGGGTIAEDSEARAAAPVERIEVLRRSLADMPLRGRPRPDVRSDVRSITMDRRIVVPHRVLGDVVEILDVLRGGRHVGSLVRPDDDPD